MDIVKEEEKFKMEKEIVTVYSSLWQPTEGGETSKDLSPPGLTQNSDSASISDVTMA